MGQNDPVDIGSAVADLSGNIFVAKKQLVDRLDSLTGVICSMQQEMARASVESSRQTEALVWWTRVLAVLTGVYTLLTGGLLIAAWLRT